LEINDTCGGDGDGDGEVVMVMIVAHE